MARHHIAKPGALLVAPMSLCYYVDRGQTITVSLAMVGLTATVHAATRSCLLQTQQRHGRREELLRGPMYYGIIHTAMTLMYWRSSPAGMTALAVLCGGDGLADIVGRRWGRLLGPLPHNKSKVRYVSCINMR